MVKESDSSVWHVVGDRFTAFASNPQVVTASALIATLRGERPFTFAPSARFLAGQGLRPEQAAELMGLAVGSFAPCFERFRLPGPASAALVHKKLPENILISAPRRSADGAYEAMLLLHEGNGIFADRTTGQHVEGLILMEAARQLAVAATELLLQSEHGAAPDLSFALTVMNNTFHQFVFPIEARLSIRIEVKVLTLGDERRYSCHSVASGHQNGRVVFEQEARYVVFSRPVIAAIEAKRAIAAARGG